MPDERTDHRDPTHPDDVSDDGLDDDTVLARAQAAMRDTRARLAETPAHEVVANHAMGLYELAAIHLSATPPALGEAALAIDAVGCLVEGLGDRLGPNAPTLHEALSNIRLAFVQIKGAGRTDHAETAEPDPQ